MTDVLSFPFRIDPVTGRAATVTAGGQAEAGEAVAMLALTRPGERQLCPGFGIPDPAYTADLDMSGEVQAGLLLWGPDGVRVASQSLTLDPATGVADVTLTFTTGGS